MRTTVLVLALLLVPTLARPLEGIEIGRAAPSFELSDHSGERFTEGDLKGGTGVLLFWSTWSPRSAEILEDFRGYHGKYAAEGLRVFAINCDHEGLTPPQRELISSYADEMDLPFPVLVDEFLEAYSAYGVMALPSAVVLDGDGRIAYALGGYPPTYRKELKESILKLLTPGEPWGLHEKAGLKTPSSLLADTH